jgi:hypothetical protein
MLNDKWGRSQISQECKEGQKIIEIVFFHKEITYVSKTIYLKKDKSKTLIIVLVYLKSMFLYNYKIKHKIRSNLIVKQVKAPERSAKTI